MIKFRDSKLFNQFLTFIPIILLFTSVLNQFDFNYLGLDYFSFNFSYILIFYFSLKKSEGMGYILIFIAGLFNDVINGTPLGLSSLLFLITCGAAAYLRNITLRPNIIKDCLFFLLTILIINSISFFFLTIFFSYEFNYISAITNIFFTFVFYFIFSYMFNILNRSI
jgi:rod shape-determining protein MreD